MRRLAVRNEQKRKTPEKCPLFSAWFIQSHPLKTYNLKSLCPNSKRHYHSAKYGIMIDMHDSKH